MDDRRKRMLSWVIMAHLFNDASIVVLPLIFPVLIDKKFLVVDYSAIGNMTMVGLVMAMICQALIGHYARPRHTRVLLALDTVVTGVFLLLVATSTSYWMLVVFFIGIRIGTSVYHPAGIAWVSHSFTGHSLDRAMGFQSAFGDLGVLLAFISTGFLIDHMGWKAPVLIWGAATLAGTVAGLMISRGTVTETEIAEQKENEKEPHSWMKAFRAFGIFIPISLLGGLAWGITLNYAPNLFHHRLGLSMSSTGTILAFWIGAGTISALFFGHISKTMTRKYALLAACAVSGVAAFALALSTDLVLVFTMFTLFGFALFIIYPALLSFISDAVDTRHKTTTFAINANLGIIGNSIFAWASGRISDIWGIQAPFFVLGAASLFILAYTAVIIRSGRISAR